MKKILIILLTMFIIVGCDKAQKTDVDINLEGNPTTGYEWNCSSSDKKVLELEITDYKSNESSSEMVGVGGVYTFGFVSKNDGEATITCEYARSFEDGHIYRLTYNFEVTAGESKLLSKEGIYSKSELPDPVFND